MSHPIRARLAALAALVAFFLSTGCGNATPPPVEARGPTSSPGAIPIAGGAPGAEERSADRSFAANRSATPPYYRVDGGRGATLFLLGTIHVGPEAGWQLSAPVEAAIAKADRIALEVDLRLATEDAVSSLVAELALLPQGRQVSDVVAPETAKLLESEDARLTRLGVPPGMRKLMKPWFMATVIGESIYGELGLSSQSAVEYRILEAIGDRPLVGLETFEQQLRMLDEVEPGLQDLMLRETLMQLDESRDLAHQLIAAWRDGDEAELARLAREGVDELPELDRFYDIVLGDRNRRWIWQLRPLLDGREHAGQDVLVAVGALHLVGEDNLVSLLRKAGYRVEKVAQR
jgi:uncharacterized protein YbaP (TraB family)